MCRYRVSVGHRHVSDTRDAFNLKHRCYIAKNSPSFSHILLDKIHIGPTVFVWDLHDLLGFAH
jgi:hypothetical protein